MEDAGQINNIMSSNLVMAWGQALAMTWGQALAIGVKLLTTGEG